MILPTELREIVRHGLLSFPVTPFDAEDRFAASPCAAHLEGLHPIRLPAAPWRAARAG